MTQTVENITKAEFEALPVQQRLALQAYIDLGSYENVADALTIPLGTVKSRINRARAKILAMRAAAALDPVGP